MLPDSVPEEVVPPVESLGVTPVDPLGDIIEPGVPLGVVVLEEPEGLLPDGLLL